MNIRKITALAGSLLMTGLTVTTAAAAAFPAPFVQNGVGDVAIVYGASSLDQGAATNVQTALAGYATKGSVSVDGGEAFKLERSSNKFNFGDNFGTAYSSLSDEELTFLSDGKYRDGDINTEYSQKITLGTGNALSYFKDSSYKNNEPTMGFNFASGDTVLTYQITFDDSLNTTEMEGTDLPLLGREYYVKDASNTKIVLYDSAEKTMIARDETLTVNGKTVTLEFLGDNGARFKIDGESIKSLGVNQDYELKDGSFLVVSDIMTSGKESVTDKVEFSIGKGKITLQNNTEVVMGDDTIRGLKTIIEADGDNVKSISLQWNSYRKSFLGEGETITMPGFENIGMYFGGMDYSTSSEKISLQNGDTMILNMGHYELPLAYINSTGSIFLGEENYPLKLTADTVTNASVNYSKVDTTLVPNATVSLDGGLAVVEGDRFIVTKLGNYLSDVTTLYYEVDRIVYNSATDFEVVLRDQIGSNDLTFTSLRGRDRGDVTVTLAAVGEDDSQEGEAYLKFTSGVLFDNVVSEKGLVANLSAFDVDGTMTITFTEANEKDEIEEGTAFTVTVGANTDEDRLHVNSTSVSTINSGSNRDLYTGVVSSKLATKVTFDKSGDENDFEIEYFGKEVTADVQVVVGGEVTTTSSLGNVMIRDSEVSNSNAKNLVVVGGSAINTAAATLLGGAHRGEAFTAATGVGPNEFLIKGFANSAINGKFALLVAGYEAADTNNAVTYLTNKKPDTSKEWKGTTATAQAVEVTSN